MPSDVRHPAAVGICGKLPARGDFVRFGLPRDFVDGWDLWLSTVLSAFCVQAGESWLSVFLQAPVWRFALPPGLCGAGAVIGVMMPSVDRAGRYFPLTLAAVGNPGGFAIDAVAEAWLDQCQAAGLAALDADAEPDTVIAMLGTPALPSAGASEAMAAWWTEGSPLVPATRMTSATLPDATLFAAMLGAVSDTPLD